MARVLLVEDEITVLILAESVIQGLGHSTYSAGSVVQGLALLDDPGEIDLLFTDIRLPKAIWAASSSPSRHGRKTQISRCSTPRGTPSPTA